MGPCASTFLSSDHVSDFQILVGLLPLHIPMALTVNKREIFNNQMVCENRFGWSMVGEDINLTYNSYNGTRSVPSKSAGWDGRS